MLLTKLLRKSSPMRLGTFPHPLRDFCVVSGSSCSRMGFRLLPFSGKRDQHLALRVFLLWTVLRAVHWCVPPVQTVEFLEALLDALKGQNYHLSDYEAGLFIPCLVEKVGRPACDIRCYSACAVTYNRGTRVLWKLNLMR